MLSFAAELPNHSVSRLALRACPPRHWHFDLPSPSRWHYERPSPPLLILVDIRRHRPSKPPSLAFDPPIDALGIGSRSNSRTPIYAHKPLTIKVLYIINALFRSSCSPQIFLTRAWPGRLQLLAVVTMKISPSVRCLFLIVFLLFFSTRFDCQYSRLPFSASYESRLYRID